MIRPVSLHSFDASENNARRMSGGASAVPRRNEDISSQGMPTSAGVMASSTKAKFPQRKRLSHFPFASFISCFHFGGRRLINDQEQIENLKWLHLPAGFLFFVFPFLALFDPIQIVAELVHLLIHLQH